MSPLSPQCDPIWNVSSRSGEANRRKLLYSVTLPVPLRFASAAISYGPVFVRPSVRLSVTNRCSIETAARIELVFGT